MNRCNSFPNSLISIHAPPRGATDDHDKQPPQGDISIHAPPRGATPTRTATSGRPEYFNSRPSARGDAMRGDSGTSDEFQFTPLREGRRASRRRRPTRLKYFNSRPSARGDAHSKVSNQARHHFNSRPSARGDDRAAADVRRSVYFNSRPSARGDSARTPGRSREPISIHAPPRGATIVIILSLT